MIHLYNYWDHCAQTRREVYFLVSFSSDKVLMPSSFFSWSFLSCSLQTFLVSNLWALGWVGLEPLIGLVCVVLWMSPWDFIPVKCVQYTWWSVLLEQLQSCPSSPSWFCPLVPRHWQCTFAYWCLHACFSVGSQQDPGHRQSQAYRWSAGLWLSCKSAGK